jgi:hypothetical protein
MERTVDEACRAVTGARHCRIQESRDDRTGVLARWAAALLAVSTVATAALAVLPEAFNRPFAVPEGIALIGLGVSLWRNHTDVPVVTVASRSVRDSVSR